MREKKLWEEKNIVKNKTNTLLDKFLALLGKFYTKIKFLNYVHKCLEFFLKEDNRKFNYDACAIQNISNGYIHLY